MEITTKVAHLGVLIYEIAISYHGRTFAEGKKIGWKDGFCPIRGMVILFFNFPSRVASKQQRMIWSHFILTLV